MRYLDLFDILKKPTPMKSTLTDDLLLQRVIQFTDIEDTFLDVWLALEVNGNDELAAKVLNAGLLFEHYLSQLADDPADRSPGQVAQLETFRLDAQTALDEGRSALGRPTSSSATREASSSSDPSVQP